MRIAIVAPGGVGGFFGALLARSGESVAALARGRHLAAIVQHGLRLEGPHGDFRVRIEASDDASKLGIADVVVFAIKLFQAEDAARAARPLFGPDTIGISLLNGIEGPDLIGRVLPEATILPGCAYVSAMIAEPGLIRSVSTMSAIMFGAPASGTSQHRKAVEFAERCQPAGIKADLVADVRSALWNKLIGLSTNSALTTAARLPAGPLYTDPDVVAVAVALIAEAAAVARAQGATLPDDVEGEWLERLKGFPPGLYASMYHDIAKGNPIEVDGLSGHIVREGRRLSVPTPHHAALYAVLKPYHNGVPATAAS